MTGDPPKSVRPKPLDGATTKSTAPPARALVLEPGAVVGRYVVIQPLGRGGMSQVVRAHDTQLARNVAVKVLLTETASEAGRQRMLREAQAMAQLSHPNVVQIFDVGTHEGNVYLAMEFVDGEPLDAWLRRPHPRREVLSIMKQAGRGLAAAHAAGIVHRDFKPANVVVAKDGRARVLDFGIARAAPGSPSSVGAGSGGTPTPYSPGAMTGLGLPASGSRAAQAPAALSPAPSAVEVLAPTDPATDSSSSGSRDPSSLTGADDKLTEEGAIVGTPGYFAPETVFDQSADARSDIFSFCVTLWRALYGTLPFQSSSVFVYVEAIGKEEILPPPPGRRVPAWLHGVIRKGLSSDPALRPQSMDELLLAIDNDPLRKRIAAGAALTLSAAAFAAVLAQAHHRRAVHAACVAEGAAIRTEWTASRRRAIEQAMLAGGDPAAHDRATRIPAMLEAYAAQWQSFAQSSCEATRASHTQSADQYERRSACLLAAREQLDAALDVLGRPNPAVQRHAFTTTRLPALGLCDARAAEHTFVPLPADPTLRAKAEEARSLIARATILSRAGLDDEAAHGIERARSLAQQAGAPAEEASALIAGAQVLWRKGDEKAARDSARQACMLAEGGGFDRIAGLAAAESAFLVSNRAGMIAEGQLFVQIARAKLGRVGEDEELERTILVPQVVLEGRSGDVQRALADAKRVVELDATLYGASSSMVCADTYNAALGLQKELDAPSVIARMRRAIACFGANTSPKDPSLDGPYLVLARESLRAADLDAARAAAAHVLELRASAGSKDEARAAALLTLAQVDELQGQTAAAEENARSALAVIDGKTDWLADSEPLALFVLGSARLATGDTQEARTLCQRATTLQQTAEPPTPDKTYSPDALRCLGEAELALGDVVHARKHLEQSAALPKRLRPDELPRARFAFARALAVDPDPDVSRAGQLVEQARIALRAEVPKAPWMKRWLDEAEQWSAVPPKGRRK